MPLAPHSAAPLRAADDGEPGGPAFSPLYRQIKSLLVRGLESGEWKPGEAIPSEIELATRFKVSQGTVRKAIDELAADNLVRRRQGKGTFVASHAEQKIRYRFLRLAPDDGQAMQAQRRLLGVRRLRAPADVARLLELKSGDTVVQVQRLMLFRDQPVTHDEIWLPGAAFKGLTAERLREHAGPLYGLFESEFGIRLIRAEEKVRAVLAEPEVAALLELPAGAPLLAVERLSFTYGDRPVELRRCLCDTASHHYRNELS